MSSKVPALPFLRLRLLWNSSPVAVLTFLASTTTFYQTTSLTWPLYALPSPLNNPPELSHMLTRRLLV